MPAALSNVSVNRLIGTNVTVTGLRAGQLQPRQVLATPGQKTPTSVTSMSSQVVEKVLLKAVSKGAKKAKKDPKTFTLRNINTSEVCSSKKLKQLIKNQLNGDIVEDFDVVGVLQGTNVVSIRNVEDMKDVWSDIKKGIKVVLWCDGLKMSKRKRKPVSGDDSDDDFELTPKTKRAKKVEEHEDAIRDSLKELKDKHGHSFTPMQFRIWAEMLAGETHSSVDEPPSTSMLVRAGSAPVQKKDTATQALTVAARAIASALSPPVTGRPSSSGLGSSPAKLIDGWSQLLSQCNLVLSMRG